MQIAPGTKEPLNLLIVEDSEEDAELAILELERAGFSPVYRRVETPDQMKAALDERPWDLVLSDYSMPHFSMASALSMVQERGLDVPFVIVSATIGEEAAVNAMKAGARDFVTKHNLSRLAAAVRRELRESDLRRERRRLEEQLRQAQKLESLGLLAGGIAHDFNNLLTGMLGNASLALDTWNPPEPARSMLQDVINASERAADLTRQLLAYAGKGRFFIQPVDVSEVVREMSTLIRASISKKIELIFNLEDHLPSIEADSSQIQQLVMNLVLNGAEAIGDESGAVVVTTSVAEFDRRSFHGDFVSDEVGPGKYVFLEVQDTGCGMDEPTIPQIFDPFFTTKFTGRGLGLAAAIGIVRGHKGAIQVTSAPGQGSTFRVMLPAKEAARAAVPVLNQRATAAQELSGTGAVLLIDDEYVVRRAARNTLERYGYTVFEAPDGRSGVEMFERLHHKILVVLLDLAMPVMDGKETYQELIRIRPEVKVIVSSGYEEDQVVQQFTGKVEFIKKPYTYLKLAEKVKELLAEKARTF